MVSRLSMGSSSTWVVPRRRREEILTAQLGFGQWQDYGPMTSEGIMGHDDLAHLKLSQIWPEIGNF